MSSTEYDKKQLLLSTDVSYYCAMENETNDLKNVQAILTALRQSETMYRQVVEDQTELICRYRPDGVLTFVNKAYCRYFGKTADELIGRSFMPLIPEEDQKIMNDALAQLSPDNPVTVVTHRVILPDGTIRWQEWTDRFVYDADGTLIEGQAVGRDITEHKKLLDRTQRHEAELSAILESIVDGVLFVDLERRVIYLNPQFGELFGYTQDELRGQNTEMLYADADAYDAQGEARFNRNADKNLNIYRVNYKHKDGSTFIGETVGTVVKTPLGERIGYVGVVRDVTDRVAAEKELEEYRNDLETLVDSRTASLKLQMKALQEYDHVISHDVRAPIRTMREYAKILQEDFGEELPDEANMYLERMKSVANQTMTLIEDLLSFSRIGRNALSADKIELSDLIHDIIETLHLPDNQTVIVGKYLPTIQTSRSMCQQMLQNLIQNGLKFNRSEQKMIKIEWDWETNELSVQDNGIGIEEKYRNKIFEPFKRLHTQSDYEGSGIGLATVRKCAETMGITVRVESTMGVGTTFFLTLPSNLLVL